MSRVLIFFAGLVLFCQPVSLCAQQPPPENYQVPEAYEIYASILSASWSTKVANAKKLLIKAETGTYSEMCVKPEGESVAVLAPVIANFIEVNKKQWLLEKTIPMERPYEFVYAKEIESFFANGLAGWGEFYKKYPDSGGFNEVSAVGFNADKTVAIVYAGHSCGGLCGGGQYYILEKKNGRWQEMTWKGTTCSWVS